MLRFLALILVTVIAGYAIVSAIILAAMGILYAIGGIILVVFAMGLFIAVVNKIKP